MPEPPPGDSVSNQGTSGVILMRSQGTELLLAREMLQESALHGMSFGVSKFTWVHGHVQI